MFIQQIFNFKTAFFILISVIACALMTVQSAYSTPTLRLDDGFISIDVADQSPMDSNPAVGAVTYNDGDYGNFTFAFVSVSTGVTYPILGSKDAPILHLDTVEVTGAGTLDIYFSESGFGPTDLQPFQTDIGGITAGTVTGRIYADDVGNSLFGGTLLSTLGPHSSGSFNGTDITYYDPANTYSLTTQASITHTGIADVTSLNLQVAVVPEVAVPEAATFYLLGSCVLGLGAFRKKYMKK